jgi:hypothetical protein
VKTAIQLQIAGGVLGLPALLYQVDNTYNRPPHASALAHEQWRFLCSLLPPKSCAWPKEKNLT